ncbi:MAG: ABC transporter substrate-binding protein, partial [Pseudonocardia sp.]
MRTRHPLRVLLITIVAAATALAGCSAPSPAGGPTDAGQSIVIGAGSEQENLNPILGYAPDGASKVFDG